MTTENDDKRERIKALLGKLMDGWADDVTEAFGVDLVPRDMMLVDPNMLRMAISSARIMKLGIARGTPDHDGSHEAVVFLVEHIIFLERQLGRMPDA